MRIQQLRDRPLAIIGPFAEPPLFTRLAAALFSLRLAVFKPSQTSANRFLALRGRLATEGQ